MRALWPWFLQYVELAELDIYYFTWQVYDNMLQETKLKQQLEHKYGKVLTLFIIDCVSFV